MHTKARLAKITAGMILLFVVLGLFLVGRRTVLIRLSGNVESQHALYLLNPMRDRGPERVAEKLLQDVQGGRCTEVSIRLTGKVDPSCSRDTELRIVSWRLRAREDNSSQDTALLYMVKRDFGPNWGIRDGDPYWINLKKQQDDSWKVVSIERWF